MDLERKDPLVTVKAVTSVLGKDAIIGVSPSLRSEVHYRLLVSNGLPLVESRLDSILYLDPSRLL